MNVYKQLRTALGLTQSQLATYLSVPLYQLAMVETGEVLLAETPVGGETKTETLCLEIMQREALKKMKRCGPGAQALLQLQADAFLYQAQQARDMMR